METDKRDDLVPTDDAIIGRAFRWSAGVILLLTLAGVLAWRLTRPAAETTPVREKVVGQVADLPAPAAPLPQVTFTDVTSAAGIRFVHTSGARGRKLLPETMGAGAAFLDHDGDGDQDLLFVNSTWWPGEEGEGPAPTQALYRNDGDGRFQDVTRQAGLDLTFHGMGVAVGDMDGDGDPDLYLTALGPNRLLRNDGGRFTDVTAASGTGGAPDAWSTSAGFFDYDNDGDLDLFVCNYVRWSPEIDLELNFTLNGRDRAYGPPTNYEGVHPYLFRNEGGGVFTDVSREAGIQVANSATGLPEAKALALSFADLDQDGFMDVLVANDTTRNFLFHNRGDGTFQEVGTLAGVGYDGAGKATGAMGIDVARGEEDRLAVAIGNFANEMTSFYMSWPGQSLRFTDEAAGQGVGAPSRLALSFGLFFFDYDLDGRLDLLQANGHLEEDIQQVQASQTYRQPVQLFWNAGPDARLPFVEVPPEATGDLSRPLVGRGAAYADMDGDGDLDVVLTQAGGPPLLLRNDQALGHHWLRLALEGAAPNRDAIGAWVELTADGRTQRLQVMPTRSYLSQVERPVTFGLGGATRIESLRVLWPGGGVQEVEVPGVDRVIRVRQAAAR